MKIKSISLIVGLMSIALLGVMAMQLYFLKESYTLKTQLFNQSVNEALSNLVAKLEKQDAFNFLDTKEKEQEQLKHNKPALQYVYVKTQSKPKEHKIALAESDYLVEKAQQAPLEEYTNQASAVINSRAYYTQNEPSKIFNKPKNGFHTDTAIASLNQLAQKPVRMPAGGSGTKSLRDSRRVLETTDDRYARLLQTEQYKSDKLFEKQDSIIRQKFPVAFSSKDALPNEDEIPSVNLQMDVVQFQDAFGQVHEQTNVRVIPREEAVQIRRNRARLSERRDSIKKYIIVDPVEGPKMIILPKPKMTQVSPQILQEDHTNQLKAAKRINKYVREKVNNKTALQDIVTEFSKMDVPLSERIKFSMLDSLLNVELKNRGIETPFQYKVSSSKKDSVIFTRASVKQSFKNDNTYQTKLFPKDIISDAGLLTVTFPEKNSVIFSNMSAMMGSSAGLLLVLIFCFGYTLHSILRQKKVSEMKTDFINNMTHEFKTPVATIMIASEALKDPEVTEDQQRIKRLAGIIYDENVRLGNHIERVLNIAKIDKDDLKLEYKPVDMNELLTAITDSMALQFQKRDAVVNVNLGATQPVVTGDELHLSNVIFNLLDNAIKYSRENPEIDISTLNAGNNLVIRVADKGIGMNRDQLSKIFDQFYRIPTGNLHDVKGFGLGLSYVNDIVKRLHGTVKVISEKDKGSEFQVILPVNT